MKSQEIKDIYFGFYDQLIEPYCSQAKENYSGDERIPHFLTQALKYGFEWQRTYQGRTYWNNVYKDVKEYLKQNNDSDMVNHPNHYGGDTTYEYFKVAEAWGWHKRAYLWNAGKYMCRTGKKSKDKEIEDLEKAIVYLNKEIELLRNGN